MPGSNRGAQLVSDAVIEAANIHPAEGTFVTSPERVNDGNVGTVAAADAANQFAYLDLPSPMVVGQWRYYGDALNNADGVWRIVVRSQRSASWYHIGDYPTNLGVWTGWNAFVGQVVVTEIRISSLVVDSSLLSRLAEVEFKA